MAARFLLAALSIGAATVAVAEDLEWCGNARYFPSEYTCFDDSFMCPVSFGLPSLPCNGGCFADQMYRCDDGALNLRGPQKAPFVLKTASASAHVDGLVIRACGGYLAIGAGARECHGCQDSDGVDCEEYGNQVVLLPNGEMVSGNGKVDERANENQGGKDGLECEVLTATRLWMLRAARSGTSAPATELCPTPGRRTRLPRAKALVEREFLVSHSPRSLLKLLRSLESGAVAACGLTTFCFTVFEDGFFAPKSHPYWLSCLRTLPGGTPGTTRSYRLYSPNAPGVADLKCDQVKLVASSADKKDGAFQWH